MRTLAGIFLEKKAQRDRGSPALPARVGDDGVVGEVGDAYLRQPDLPSGERELAEGVVGIVAAVVGRKPVATGAGTDRPRAAPPPLGVPVAVLAAVLIASILLGTTILSVVLAAALGVLGYVAAGGAVLGLAADRWPFAPRKVAAVEEAAGRADGVADARVEAALRRADSLLARARQRAAAMDVEAAPVPALAAPALQEGHLQFLQDLAEAGGTGDGRLAVELARRRLPAVTRALGVRLATLADADARWFAFDEVPDAARRGTEETLRPAVLRGEECLARGYARRYV